MTDKRYAKRLAKDIWNRVGTDWNIAVMGMLEMTTAQMTTPAELADMTKQFSLLIAELHRMERKYA